MRFIKVYAGFTQRVLAGAQADQKISPHDINALLVINNINTIFRYYISNFLENIHQVIAEIYLISFENVTVLIHLKKDLRRQLWIISVIL